MDPEKYLKLIEDMVDGMDKEKHLKDPETNTYANAIKYNVSKIRSKLTEKGDPE